MNKFDFKGRVAMVTGAARGLGLAITERLLDGGASVSMWDMDRAALNIEAKRLAAKGKVHTAVVDVVNDSEECSFTTGGVFDLSGGRATY